MEIITQFQTDASSTLVSATTTLPDDLIFIQTIGMGIVIFLLGMILVTSFFND